MLLVALLLAGVAAAPLAAQPHSASLARRMDAFLQAMEEGGSEGIAAFFPRRGDFTWVQTQRDEAGRVRQVRTWRFPGREALRAIREGGPLCESFLSATGEVGPYEGRLRMQVEMHGSVWRRVRGNRFVPAGRPADLPVFVQWRREEGEWVVSALGDEGFHAPRLLGQPRSMVVRDTALPLPPDRAYAGRESWYREHAPITFDGYRYVKYGLPRPRAELPHLVRIGRLGPVPIYVERDRVREPDVIFVPVRRGEYQLYEGYRPTFCR